jgi:hypothetical protein
MELMNVITITVLVAVVAFSPGKMLTFSMKKW